MMEVANNFYLTPQLSLRRLALCTRTSHETSQVSTEALSTLRKTKISTRMERAPSPTSSCQLKILTKAFQRLKIQNKTAVDPNLTIIHRRVW
jgi:hypothetical protein